jgi:hypothetical protein
MDAAEEEVNWSAVAAQAFEAKLAEIASRKETKTLNDVIQRLRASKQRASDDHYREGEEAGRRWAENEAEADELARLERAQGRADAWELLFEEAAGQSYSAGELLYFVLHPENHKDRSEASDFWECALGDDTTRTEDGSYVRGFAEGALALWREVKDKL